MFSIEVSDDVIACDLWFGPSSSIKNPGYAYVQISTVSLGLQDSSSSQAFTIADLIRLLCNPILVCKRDCKAI